MYTGKHVTERNDDATKGRWPTISCPTSSGDAGSHEDYRLSERHGILKARFAERRDAGAIKGSKRPRSAPFGAQLYGRGREVHAWQTLRGAVARLSSVRPESGRRP